ncbi:MAG: hypothetical protein ACKV2Q_19540 [Planctomycetaceae bacterium]
MRHFGWCVVVGGLWLTSSGCALMHDMQPHRLWRWNRGPAPSTNPFFSVSDPIPQLGAPGEIPESASAAMDPANENRTVQ